MTLSYYSLILCRLGVNTLFYYHLPLTMTGPMKNKIFVQIASYRDPELLPTLKDMIEKSSKPNNLSIGICWQHSEEDEWDNLDEFKNDKRFKIIDVDYTESKGVCWARNAVQSLYDGEKYTLQLDSHHRFVEGWDDKLIKMLKRLQKDGYEKPLLTAYIPSFDPENDPDARVMKPWKMNFDRFTPEGVVFFIPAEYDSWDDSSKPLLSRFYSAHFGFTVGEFCKEVKHDPNYYFHGEEISIAARAFTHGYDMFHPNEVIIWHEYTRKGRTKQWDDDKEWYNRNTSCHLRNRKLFEMDGEKRDIDFGEFGFGEKRTLQEYEKFSGICFGNRSITQDVIDKKVPKFENIKISDEDFQKSLSRIFKHCIDIQYDQVPEKDYDFWCVAFRDENDQDVYRQDADLAEIERIKNDPDGYIKLWREFNTTKQPKSWIVWPHSISKGWLNPLTGHL